MKNIKELEELRKKLKTEYSVHKETVIKIIIGMGTCGIAAGAKKIMNYILEEINKRNISGIEVTQTGCIGMCMHEPLVDIINKGGPRVTYGRVTQDIAYRIISEYIINSRIIEDAVIGKIEE